MQNQIHPSIGDMILRECIANKMELHYTPFLHLDSYLTEWFFTDDDDST